MNNVYHYCYYVLAIGMSASEYFISKYGCNHFSNLWVIIPIIIIINAFLMRRIPLWLHMWDAESAIHETLQQSTTYLIMHCISHSILSPSLHPHTRTPTPTYAQFRNTSLPPSLSTSHSPPKNNNETTHQSASEDISSKIKIKSSTASNACERVNPVLNWANVSSRS